MGETGLDYFRTGQEGRAAQQDVLPAHIDLAKRLGKTLVIHDRDAHDDVLRVVDEEGAPERFVMHCFSGDADFARRLPGPRAPSCRSPAPSPSRTPSRCGRRSGVVPQDRVLVETDAPFLTPTPYRGRPNASYLVPLTVRSMAETRGEDLAGLCEAVEANTYAAFGGAW